MRERKEKNPTAREAYRGLKFKFLLIVPMFFVVFALTLVGVWAAKTVSVGVSGTITYQATDVYATITGSVSGAKNNVTFSDLNYSADSTPSADALATWKNKNIQFQNAAGANYGADIVLTITIQNHADRALKVKITDNSSSSANLTRTIGGAGTTFEVAAGATTSTTITFRITDKNKSVSSSSFNYTISLNDPSYVEQNAYLLQGSKWQAALQAANANYTNANIKTIEFTNTAPTGSDYTLVSVGATDSTGTTAYVAGTTGVVDVTAYVKANSSESSKYDVIFYSTGTIYAPVDSSRLFVSLSNIASITFSNFNTSNVTIMYYMFYDCNSMQLKSLDLSSFNTSNVTNMYGMFYDCRWISSITLSSFNTSNVTSLSSMFSGCWSIYSLDLSNFNTSIVTNMSGMFYGCSSLITLNLSSFDMSKVKNTRTMLSNCSALTEIQAPKAINSSYPVTLPTKTNYSWVDQASTSTTYTKIDSTNVGKTLILKAN